MGPSLEEITKKITKDAEQCASKCWWEAHDKKDYTKAGDLFAKQEKIIATYAGNKPVELEIKIANCFALTLQTYDNFTKILKTGEGTIEDLEKQLTEMLFDVHQTLDTNVKAAGRNAEAARHNMEWWMALARMRLAQKLMAKAQTDAEKVSAKNQYRIYDERMVWHITAEHKARYGFDDKNAEKIVKAFLKTEQSHNSKDYIRAKQLLKPYYIALFSALSLR